ncbi:pentapeptide repeat-containing protein [Nonomuraea sp. 10N515B]|uniref:pentapeptide repeat-containing protein n=1 Tax=Nonomuraea sp. 10N515B TaxID=3457422 RepID=UPI003FCCBCB9
MGEVDKPGKDRQASDPPHPAAFPGLRLMRIGTALALVTGSAVVLLTVVIVGGLTLLGVQGLRPEARVSAATLFDLLKISFAVVAGLGGLVALVVAYRRQKVAEAAQQVSERGEDRAHRAEQREATKLHNVRRTCIDVLCAYLRMPYTPDPDKAAPETDRLAFAGLREVRHTIVRLITAHLRENAPVSWQGYDFYFTGAVFDGGDFVSAMFSGGEVSFRNTTFCGPEVMFWGATFSGGRVFFYDATFSAGEVYFADAKFSGGYVSFSGAEFSGGAVFSDGEVRFSGVKFSGAGVGFEAATFSGGIVSFAPDSQFSAGEVIFDHATFSGSSIPFIRANFSGGRVSFRHAEFTGSRINFEGLTFSGGEVSFDKATFSGGQVDLSSVRSWAVPPVGLPLPRPPGSAAAGRVRGVRRSGSYRAAPEWPRERRGCRRGSGGYFVRSKYLQSEQRLR